MNPALALKLLSRDWRSGELTLLLGSLIIAVATVTTITLFVDRLQQALVQESAQFLAADRVISGRGELDPEYLQKAESLGLEHAQTLSFLSMVFSADRAQFSSVKAVTDEYPLRGNLIISDEAFRKGDVVARGPAPGKVWLESRLLPSLDLKPGDMLDIGVATFFVEKALIKEPDRGGGFNNVGPRVMMNMVDVPRTEVVQPGSRLSYRYLFSGPESALVEFDEWARPKLGEDFRMFGVKEGTEGIGNALARAERFLLLGGLLGVVLAGVAIALSAQRYSLRHYDHVAILKTLGATPNGIDSLFITIFVTLGL
ncbi:MAG: putative ABC transport system permease protein, partial [Candidatus Azotimanducaceae bacterium]